MSTAITRIHAPAWRRLCTLALAGTLAVGTMLPGVAPVWADGESGQPTMTPASSFSVSVDSVDALTGLHAVITGSGDGVNLRRDPAHDADVVSTLKDGTVVDLRIDTVDTVLDPDGTTRWWPVRADGEDGWVSGFYLKNPDAPVTGAGSEAETPVTGPAFDYTGEIKPGITAQVSADGDGVNVRSEPSDASDVATTVQDGATVTLRIDTTDTVTDKDGTRWWPVSANGKDGWISGAYLRSAGTSGESPSAPGQSGTFAAGSYVRVRTPSGQGVVVRAEPKPNGAELKVWADGQVAQVMEGPLSFEASENGWYKVTTGDLTGYVDGDLLIVAGQPASSNDANTSAAFVRGDNAQVKTQKELGANIRADGDPTSAKVGYVPEGAVVTIEDGPASHASSTAGWFKVTFDGVTGYVDGDLLVKTSASASSSDMGDEGVAGDYRKGDYVIVATNSKTGANVRALPTRSSDTVGFLAETETVQVIDGPMKDENGDVWYKVSDGGDTRGWVAGNLLDPTKDPQAVATTTPAAVEKTPAATSTTPTPAPGTSGQTATTPTPSPASSNVSSQGFIYPLASYTVTQGFGCSNLGFYSYDATLGCPIHDGLDLAAPAGTPIMAAAAGTVVAAGWCDCGLGNYVEIDHGNGVHTVYGHMQSQPYVSVGQQVAQGEVIGPVGSTGLSTGPHTHFMVRIDGVAQDPVNYLP